VGEALARAQDSEAMLPSARPVQLT